MNEDEAERCFEKGLRFFQKEDYEDVRKIIIS